MSTDTNTELISGEFLVIFGYEGGFDLFDLETSTPILVTANSESYDDNTLQDTLTSLDAGNHITATLEETGEVRETAIFESPVYRFKTLDINDRTQFYQGYGDIPVVGSAQDIVTKLTKSGAGIGRATIRDGKMTIGRVVVFNREHPTPAEPVFERELQSLREFGEPPFHVFQTATDDARFFVHYYLVTTETKLGSAFLDHIGE